MSGDEQTPSARQVGTWREGVFLTREEKVQLAPEQLRQYLDASVITDLTEIDGLPEPMRSRLQDLVAQARARVEARIAETESRQAS